MFKKLKLSNRKKIIINKAAKINYDKEGRAIIDVGLKNSDDFFSPYSYLSSELMNPEVEDYINTYENGIPKQDEISINIYTESSTSNDEKKRIREAVERHHAEELLDIKEKIINNRVLGTIFSVLGLLILLLGALAHKFLYSYYLDAVISVIGWLFLWDGMEIIFYDQKELKRQKIRSMRLMNAKVHINMYSKAIQKEYKIGEYENNIENKKED